MNLKLKEFLKKIFFRTLNFLSPNQSCNLNNLRQKIMKRNFYFNYDSKQKLYYVSDNNIQIYFSNKLRGFQTYSYGVRNRAEELVKTYGIEQIKFNNKDIVIDCGANYGDIFTWFKINNLKINYISFEPAPREFECLKLNCVGQKNNNLGLFDKEGFFDFFIKSDTGDSSIMEPSEGFTEKIKIRTTTLSNYINSNNIQKVKLFKVEAEGLEQEILMGAKDVLQKIAYIGVDGSAERGKDNETTYQFAREFLHSNNFKIIYSNINDIYAKELFKNNNINNNLSEL